MKRLVRTPLLLASLGSLAVLAPPRSAAAQASSSAPPPAEVADFGERHRTLVTVENVGGFLHLRQSNPDADTSSSSNYFGTFVLTQLSRVGFHRVLGHGVTFGAGLSYSNTTFGGGSSAVWALAPRLGFVLASSRTTAVWLRAGATYFEASGHGSLWQLSPAAELALVLTPFDHFGVMLGAMAEVGVAGKQTLAGRGSSEQPYRVRTYGLTLGFVFDL